LKHGGMVAKAKPQCLREGLHKDKECARNLPGETAFCPPSGVPAPFGKASMDIPRPRGSLDRPGGQVMLNHETASHEIELKLTQERLRQLEQELKEVRELAEEALRVAKRAKRGMAQQA
jgi:hypothetical protein